MEKAQVLVRTVTRAFYETQHAIIVEALIRHSALTAPDLKSFFAGGAKQKNDIPMWCEDLSRGGLVSKYVRAEPKGKGQNRGQKLGSGNTTYYYIDYRRAVDGTKYRLHTLSSEITQHSNPSAENKPYKCLKCKSEFTLLELIDSRDPLGRGSGFKCKVCGDVIPSRPRGEGQGNDTMIGLFNTQFSSIINLLREIDTVVVPDITGEGAVAAATPIPRKEDKVLGPQYIKTELEIAEEQKIRPTAVKGITPSLEKIEISITTEQENNEAARAAEQQHRAQIAAQNQMPEWYARSTITGESVKKGPAGAEAHAPGNAANGVQNAKDDEKKAGKDEQVLLDEVFARMKQEQDMKRLQEEEEEEDDDDDDDDEEDEFEEVNVTASNGFDNNKRIRDDDSTSNAASTPGTKRMKLDASAATSAVGTPAGRSESDADDDEFEEVKM